ncbi:HK97 gp10 family phage protein [Kaistia geumhonensis]|uniref:HK97 gp10 family phage protein n=1 Tax=Kaistia geumhonensis TaxID=410839 RepID=A0ABU0M5T5_9HYPH|nr:HK97-gp10 family putative phage morphogenesis protein [Kaistia geumhonensis]MCX5478453.1 HK97 gp10 family phage protein [Kaistia geumhonensis]MDQ0516329.1 HK97 gp10 family phage protein [Kaistia geumhonensis]
MATKVERLDRLKAKIAAMAPAARAEIQKALVESGEEIANLARHLAPKKSGALARSIGSTLGAYTPDNSNVRGVSAGGGNDLSVTVHAGDENAYYAAFVEFGTAPHRQKRNPFNGGEHPGSKAVPFFFPAYRAGKKRAKSRIARAVNRAAKKVASK